MKKLTISIGLLDKDSKTQLINNDDAMQKVNSCFLSRLDAFTVYFAKGVYTHENGSQIQENTIRVEVVTFNDKDYNNTIQSIKEVKKALNQETILLEKQAIDSFLI